MIRVVTGAGGRATRYRLAGRHLLCDFALSGLAGAKAAALPSPPPLQQQPGQGDEQSHLQAYLGGQLRQVDCWHDPEGSHLVIDHSLKLWIEPESAYIYFDPNRTWDRQLASYILFAPALPLLLATQQCYLLHAAAVKTSSGVIALCGLSGSGKSTLAAAAAHRWPLVADDSVPIEASSLAVAGAYPQLKLSPPMIDLKVPLPIAAVVELQPQTSQSQASLGALKQPEATLTLVRHTIASRLFQRQQLSAHLSFCRSLAITVPVYRLHYWQSPEQLPSMLELLASLI